MSDRAKAVILELAGTCTNCGAVRCANPAHFQAALDVRWEPPLLSRWAADRLIATLTRGPGRFPRHRAEQIVARDYRVIG